MFWGRLIFLSHVLRWIYPSNALYSLPRLRSMALESSTVKDGVRPEDPLQPFNLYGYWKIAGEGMAQAYHQESGVSTVSLRLATTYGPGRNRGFTAAMTSALKAVAKGKDLRFLTVVRKITTFPMMLGQVLPMQFWILTSGYGVFNLLGKTLAVDEFRALIKDEAEKWGLKIFELIYEESAELTPFIYDLNCESTRKTFPKIPEPEIRDGIRISLQYFLESQK